MKSSFSLLLLSPPSNLNGLTDTTVAVVCSNVLSSLFVAPNAIANMKRHIKQQHKQQHEQPPPTRAVFLALYSSVADAYVTGMVYVAEVLFSCFTSLNQMNVFCVQWPIYARRLDG